MHVFNKSSETMFRTLCPKSLRHKNLCVSIVFNSCAKKHIPKKVAFRTMSTFTTVPNTTSSMTNTEARPVVSIAQGKLKGVVAKLHDGGSYYSFKGIPYAQPPVGDLRFKAPLPPKPWEGTRDAAEHGEVCPQIDLMTMQSLEGSEDSLFLNVYTRSITDGANKPVIFFIHGGAYMSGSGNSDVYGPEYLLQHDVVLVTINYRLELLGFLSLDTPEVPGNAGLKDQVAALRWVKENISKFGGDPQNVTICGESAGGASVTYHMLSPMSRGLFHKAISQSGVCLCYWAISDEVKERAFRIGKSLGIDTNDINQLLQFFRSQPAVNLTNVTFKSGLPDQRYKGIPMFIAPVIEKSFPNVQAFLDRDPTELIMEKQIADVPMLIGYNSAEGLLSTPGIAKLKDVINKNFHFRVPRDIEKRVPENVLKEFGARIKEFYFQGKDMTENDLQKICDMDTDASFTASIHRFCYLYKKACKSPAYMYRFNYDTEMNFLKKMMGVDVEGANHVDELFYLFSNMMTKDVYEENEDVRQKVYKMTKMWTDFAKTGNPTPDSSLGVQWLPYTTTSKEYLSIDDPLSVGHCADKVRVEFWNKMYADAGLPSDVGSRL